MERAGALIFPENLRPQFSDCHLTLNTKTLRRHENVLYTYICFSFFEEIKTLYIKISFVLFRYPYFRWYIRIRFCRNFFLLSIHDSISLDFSVFFSFSFLILFYDVMTMIIWNFYGSQIQLLKVEDFIVPASRVRFIMILLDVFFEVVLSGSGVTGSSRRDRPNLV